MFNMSLNIFNRLHRTDTAPMLRDSIRLRKPTTPSCSFRPEISRPKIFAPSGLRPHRGAR